MKAYKILSWNFYMLPNNDVKPMIKVHPTYELMEAVNRNGNRLRIAVSNCDCRYNAVYYATIEQPEINNINEPIIYLVLNSYWAGFPLQEGYFTILGEDYMPSYLDPFVEKVHSASKEPFLNTTNVPSRNNPFSRSVGSQNTIYKKICQN